MKSDRIDKDRQPSVTIPDRVTLPHVWETRASNGVAIHSIDCPGREVLRVSFVFHAGTSWQTKPFSASATLNTLGEGSLRLSAQEIAERLDFYGSYFDVSLDRDYAVVTFCCLTKFFAPTLAIAEEVLLHPSFPDNEVRIYCAKSKQNLAINRNRVDFLARQFFVGALFGEAHPYGVSSDESCYDALTPADLRAFHELFYRAGNCFVVVSGDLSPDRDRGIAELVGKLPLSKTRPERDFPPVCSRRYRFVAFDGAVQSAVRIGKLLFPRTHPDFVGMQVVSTLLGGYFGSRLVRNLREEHGYTYGVYSAMVNLDRAGYMAVATEVGSDVTEDAVRQIFAEMERLRHEVVSAEELALAANIMVGEVLRILDGPFGIADVVIENIQNGENNDYVERFVRQVREITPERINELARRYLDPTGFTVVTVGAVDPFPQWSDHAGLGL